MLKYLWVKEVFQETPGEFSLGIAISGCRIRCPECHSRELWEDKGKTLDVETLCGLLNQHQGITCVCLFGGEHDIDALIELFMYAHKRVNTAWYSGLDLLPKDKKGLLQYLDYIKLGPYNAEYGGLSSPTTNQKLYHITHPGEKMWDITKLMQRNYENTCT